MGNSNSSNGKEQKLPGKMSFQIEKTYFQSGEIIAGQICLDFHTAFPTKCLMIQFLGLESTKFYIDEDEVDQKSQKNMEKNLLKQGLIAYDFSQGEQNGRQVIGQWKIPFKLRIAEQLPSSFQYQKSDENQCQLGYFLRAIIEPSNEKLQPIQITQNLTIIKPLGEFNNEPQRVQKAINPISFLCCLSGQIFMDAQIDKKFYNYLEEMTINLNLDASRCRFVVSSFVVTIEGILEMSSNSRHRKEQRFEICKQIIPTRNQKVNQQIKFKIPQSAKLCTAGGLIKYSNFIVVQPIIQSVLVSKIKEKLVLPFHINIQNSNNDSINNSFLENTNILSNQSSKSNSISISSLENVPRVNPSIKQNIKQQYEMTNPKMIDSSLNKK